MPRSHDREILRLAVPAFLALVAEPLFLLADAAIVGHLGTASLAGLGIAAAVLQTAVGLCVFLAYGTTASVARHLGAGDTRGALTQGIDGVWLAVADRRRHHRARRRAHRPAGRAVRRRRRGRASRRRRTCGSPSSAPPRCWSCWPPPACCAACRTPGRRWSWPSLGNAANVVLNLLLVYGAGLGIAGSALGLGPRAGRSAPPSSSRSWSGPPAARAPRSRPDLAGIRAAAHAGVAARDPHPHAARRAAGHDVRRDARRARRRRPGGGPRDPPARAHAVDLPRVRARRDRHRRPGDHRALPRRRRRGRHPRGDRPDGPVGAVVAAW